MFVRHLSDKALVSRPYKELSDKPVNKGKRFEHTFHQWIVDGNEEHRKMFNIVSHEGSANSSHGVILLCMY